MQSMTKEAMEVADWLRQNARHEAAKQVLNIAFCSGVHGAYLIDTQNIRSYGQVHVDDMLMKMSKNEKTGFDGKTDKAIEKNAKKVFESLKEMSDGIDSISF